MGLRRRGNDECLVWRYFLGPRLNAFPIFPGCHSLERGNLGIPGKYYEFVILGPDPESILLLPGEPQHVSPNSNTSTSAF